jgi:hypothetical protein
MVMQKIHVAVVPTREQITAEIARKHMFGLILDMLAEDIHGGRHVFTSRTKEGLLFDVSAWFGEAPGPSTHKYIAAFAAMIKPLKRGETAAAHMVARTLRALI